ncbi:zinc dependent phospholipase C family protein [Ruminiclostridium josui]|uniref:zinc dependent phospholipase C family protein n=1 Tax=Ruminiclostridium josui TaxID=1499 RepID=UPI001331C206|nr:zinc dependent phospholipase C family protein [Ruminiclostridium josui]
MLSAGVKLHTESKKLNTHKTEIKLVWGTSGNNTHRNIVEQALTILKNDKGSTFGSKLEEYCPGEGIYYLGTDEILYYSWFTDDLENDSSSYLGHFYGEGGVNYLGNSSPTAYERFNNHYYNAVTKYKSGDKLTAYRELGMALHYLSDLNAPHHAANKIAVLSKHTQYEDWVDQNISSFLISKSSSSYYDYVNNSTLKKMADDWSSAARANIDACNKGIFSFDSSSAFAPTKAMLATTQMAAAGLLYRFILDREK